MFVRGEIVRVNLRGHLEEAVVLGEEPHLRWENFKSYVIRPLSQNGGFWVIAEELLTRLK